MRPGVFNPYKNARTGKLCLFLGFEMANPP